MNEKVRYCQWCNAVITGLEGALPSYCDEDCKSAEAEYCSFDEEDEYSGLLDFFV